MNNRLFKLAELSSYPDPIYDILKFSAPNKSQQENRDLFVQLFPNDNQNKVYAIADQYYKRFNGTAEFHNNLSLAESLDDVINLISSAGKRKDYSDNTNLNLERMVDKYPDLKNEIEPLNELFLSWLNSRYGDNQIIKELHPISDALVTLIKYQDSLTSLSDKWKSNQEFISSVNEYFPNRTWRSPADIKNLTIDEMESLMGLGSRRKQHVEIQDDSAPSEYLGKFGRWNLWMPHTKEDSCRIAGFDPVTMKPYAEWCTARTSGSNLFYNYVGSEHIIL